MHFDGHTPTTPAPKIIADPKAKL